MIGDAPRSLSTGIPGWETPDEEAALIDLAQRYVLDGGVIVELGGEYGRSASQFGVACKDKKNVRIYTVDLFPLNHHVAKAHGGLLKAWWQNLASAGVAQAENVTFVPIQSDTAKAGSAWDGTPIDLLFVDAGHTYEEVQRDIEAWIGYVRPGGVVIFHDYAKTADAHPLHHEVKRAVDEWKGQDVEGEWERLYLPDSLVAFERGKDNAIYHDTPADVEPVAELAEALPKLAEPAPKPARKRSKRS